MQQSRVNFETGLGERFATRPKHQATNGECTYKQFSTYTSLQLAYLPCSLAPTSLPEAGPVSCFLLVARLGSLGVAPSGKLSVLVWKIDS